MLWVILIDSLSCPILWNVYESSSERNLRFQDVIRLPNIKEAKEKEGLKLWADPKAPVTASIKIHCYLPPSEPWKK